MIQLLSNTSLNVRRGCFRGVALLDDIGHLEGHDPVYTMVTCQQFFFTNMNLCFHAFCKINQKMFNVSQL